MAVLGVGVDIVEVERLEHALARWGEALTSRLFTASERSHAHHPRVRSKRLAARFAAKEAVMKALGLGWRTMAWREIEILNDPLGKPEVTLHGVAREVATARGVVQVCVSLTHTHDVACAMAIAVTSSHPDQRQA